MKTTRGRKRTKLQREMHQDEFERLHVTGMSQKDIGAKFDLSQGQVSKDLTAGFVAAQREPPDLMVLLAKELAHIDLVERDNWRAWDASTQPKVIRTDEATTSEFPKTGENALGCDDRRENVPRRAFASSNVMGIRLF